MAGAARAGDNRIGTHSPRTATAGVVSMVEQFRSQQAAQWGSQQPWSRFADWLALPTVTDADQKLVGLKAVTNDGSNYLALSATTSTGTYHVDWGDGNTSDVSSGSTASHWYDYSAIGAGTLSARGYKQVIVVVTANTGNLTGVNLNVAYSRTGIGVYETGWLDLAVAGTYLTSLTISASSQYVRMGMLEQVRLYANAITSGNYMFNLCGALQSVSLNTASFTSMNYMFQSCPSLQSVPLFNTAAVTSMQNTFNNCPSLASVPLFNTGAVTTMANMFQSCYSLQSVPLFNTGAVTTMASMFQSCPSLTSVPALNVAAVTSGNFNATFTSCPALASVAITGAVYAFTINCKLARTELVALFNALGSASGGSQTLTVSGNHGWADLSAGDKAIATGKGWTLA